MTMDDYSFMTEPSAKRPGDNTHRAKNPTLASRKLPGVGTVLILSFLSQFAEHAVLI